MGFRSRRRVEADRVMRVAVTDVASNVEARLRAQLDGLERMQSSMAELLRATHEQTERRDHDLARALVLVAAACEQSADAIEADRIERRELVGSLNELVMTLNELAAAASEGRAPVALPGRRRVLGGSVFTPPLDLDLVEEESESGSRSDSVREMNT
jgi:hypothetical protein